MSKGTKLIRAGRINILIDSYERMIRQYEWEAKGEETGSVALTCLQHKIAMLQLVIMDLREAIGNDETTV